MIELLNIVKDLIFDLLETPNRVRLEDVFNISSKCPLGPSNPARRATTKITREGDIQTVLDPSH